MSLLSSVKLAARLSTNSLDDEVKRLIVWAKSELARSGVPESAINESDPLIQQAIITGCLTQLVRDSDAKSHAQESWDYQRDVLRKHSWGTKEGVTDAK